MQNKLTKEQYNEVERLVECAISASTKESAEFYIQKLHGFEYFLTGNDRYIFSSLIISAKRASGRVSDKERLISFVRDDLSKVGSSCTEANSTTTEEK